MIWIIYRVSSFVAASWTDTSIHQITIYFNNFYCFIFTRFHFFLSWNSFVRNSEKIQKKISYWFDNKKIVFLKNRKNFWYLRLSTWNVKLSRPHLMFMILNAGLCNSYTEPNSLSIKIWKKMLKITISNLSDCEI